jgi:hypothetical protein
MSNNLITIIHAQLSDIMCDVYQHKPIDHTQQSTYEFRLLDIPSGETFTISYPQETDAVLAFAAWLSADDTLGLTEHVVKLRAAIPVHLHILFLP